MRTWLKILIVGTSLAAASCSGAKITSSNPPKSAEPAVTAANYQPVIDPSEFSSTIDNPFLPMTPGTRLIYEGRSPDGLEHIVTEITGQTKKVMGVDCVVVHDRSTIGGKVSEDTYDWYAQKSDGSVWYFGEATKAYDKGSVNTEGSWEGGVDGAQPGIVMPAHPAIGSAPYRQEYLTGEAEDFGQVVSLTETAKVPAGDFTGLIKTKDYTPLEPTVIENKYFARGIGTVLELTVKGPAERIELLRIEHFSA